MKKLSAVPISTQLNSSIKPQDDVKKPLFTFNKEISTDINDLLKKNRDPSFLDRLSTTVKASHSSYLASKAGSGHGSGSSFAQSKPPASLNALKKLPIFSSNQKVEQALI